MDDEVLLPCRIERWCEHTSMMPEIMKLVFPLILHSTFDTFSSVTVAGSSSASGEDSLDKFSHHVTASHIGRDIDEATHVRTKVPVIYWSMNEARAREVLVPATETPGTSLRRLVNCVQHSSASGTSQLHR
jgi:hypothetical protein